VKMVSFDVDFSIVRTSYAVVSIEERQGERLTDIFVF
jgi:hypothetical protein